TLNQRVVLSLPPAPVLANAFTLRRPAVDPRSSGDWQVPPLSGVPEPSTKVVPNARASPSTSPSGTPSPESAMLSPLVSTVMLSVVSPSASGSGQSTLELPLSGQEA